MEPIYQYVRGSGWVITHAPIVTTRDVTLVRLEFRVPEMDEQYDFFNLSFGEFFAYGQPVWERWIKHVASYNMADFCFREAGDTYQPDVLGYIVLVPV